MTKQQIQNKIGDLEFWLKANPNHYQYAKKLKEKQDLELKLALKNYE